MSWISAIAYFVIFNALLRYPFIAIALVLAYVFRDRIPNPAEWVRRSKQFGRLKREVAVNQHNSVARRNLGMILLEKRRPAEALSNFMEALKKEPGSAELNHFVGLSYLRTGAYEKAAEHLGKAVEIDPRLKYGESHLYLSEALLGMGRPDGALAQFDAFLAINNTSIEGLYGYATALNALGRKDEAKKAVEDGIRFHKGNPAFRRRKDWRWYVRLKALRRKL